MTMNDRSELMQALYRLQGETFALRAKAQACEAKEIVDLLTTATISVNEAIAELKGDDDSQPEFNVIRESVPKLHCELKPGKYEETEN